MNRRGLLLLLLSLGLGAALLLFRDRLQPEATLSTVITRQAEELGPGAHLLLPDLRGAEVVIPDRPHDPAELRQPDARARIQRLRRFEVSTSSRGLRSAELQPKEGFRILCLGDSVTFGWGVAREDSYPALLAEALDVEVVNAGVPAMKPQHIGRWASSLSDLDPDLILFARRPDWREPQPWRSYAQALSQVKEAFPEVPLGVLLPPVSTFDPRGLSKIAEEQSQAARRLGVPVLDLTPAFREALAKEGHILELEGGEQRILSLQDGSVYLRASSPPLRPGLPALAEEVTRAFEEDEDLKEPLFYDGGHPDVPGFRIFTREVADWVRSQGWR